MASTAAPESPSAKGDPAPAATEEKKKNVVLQPKDPGHKAVEQGLKENFAQNAYITTGADRGLAIGYVSFNSSVTHLNGNRQEVTMKEMKMIYPLEAKRKSRNPKRAELNKTKLVGHG